MIKMKWKDPRRFNSIINTKEQEVLKKAGIFAQDIAELHVNDVRSSWSATVPSSPGKPPAMRSGNLNSAPYIEYRSGGSLFTKLFASPSGGRPEDFPIAIVHWDTRKGVFSPTNQRGYAGYLEAGTSRMAARPFVKPSMRRVKRMVLAQARKILNG